MFKNDEVISYLQQNNILALKLDRAVSAVGRQVKEQIETIGAGATRALYYASCFTDEYNDVCQQQKTEDIRFRDAVYKIIRQNDVIAEMLQIYFEEVFRYKTNNQLEYIKRALMAVNIHIAATSLTTAGFTLAAASAVNVGLHVRLQKSVLIGHGTHYGVVILGGYGIVQKAVDSARSLNIQFPAYYSALYAANLEMLYFLIEPVLTRSGALNVQWASDDDLAQIIARLIR